MTDKTNPPTEPKSREWHWHPELPIGYAPYWHWPPRPVALLKWLAQNFLQGSDRMIYLATALIVGFWMQPVSPDQATFALGWMAWVLIRNWILLLIVAGGLHFWFYGIDAQGNLLKYDPRPMSARKNALFKFGYQTWDNVFYALASGAPIATGYEILLRWFYASDKIEFIHFADSPVWFVLLFPLVTIWQSLHFYFVHRALHWPPLYRRVHSIHHRNVNPGPWSGMSMHPVEHLGYFSSLLIFLIIPSHPSHMIFLLYWQLLGAPSSHSGYEAVWIKDRSRLVIGSFFHQLHHRYYECNYGGYEMPWDKWFGTHHDGSEAATRRTRDRKRKMHAHKAH